MYQQAYQMTAHENAPAFHTQASALNTAPQTTMSWNRTYADEHVIYNSNNNTNMMNAPQQPQQYSYIQLHQNQQQYVASQLHYQQQAYPIQLQQQMQQQNGLYEQRHVEHYPQPIFMPQQPSHSQSQQFESTVQQPQEVPSAYQSQPYLQQQPQASPQQLPQLYAQQKQSNEPVMTAAPTQQQPPQQPSNQRKPKIHYHRIIIQ